MPEGPSLALLRQDLQPLEGLRVERAEGAARIDHALIAGRTLQPVRTWGKHLLLPFQDPDVEGGTVRIHFLMFGSWCIDDHKPQKVAKLDLHFERGHRFAAYSCAAKWLDAPVDTLYDWRTDVMSDAFDAAHVLRLMAAAPGTHACDAVLNQDWLTGAGNIFKNEVLWRLRIHPLARIGALGAAGRRALVMEVRRYGFEFLFLKRANLLTASWQAHRQRTCPRGHGTLASEILGASQRRTHWCPACQVRGAP